MKKSMHKLLTCALLASIGLTSQAATLDRVVAVVNQDVVLASQLDSLITKVQRDAVTHNQQLPEYSQLRKQALERLIGESLVVQLADRQGLKVSDTQLDQTLASIASDQKMSVEQLKQEAAADGLSEAQFREQIRREMLMSEVRRNQMRQRINISDQEVQQVVQHRALGGIGETEIQVQRPPQPVQILHRQRLVEPQQLAGRGNHLFSGRQVRQA